METFCRSLQDALGRRYPSADVAGIWRRYVSAECPACGIQVYGDELRALALPPSAELASAKVGRMRFGNCARQGCDAWHYCVHLWNQQEIEWPGFDEAAEAPACDANLSFSPEGSWLRFGSLQARLLVYWPLAFRRCAIAFLPFGLILALWLAREFYLGGRVPYLREPEKFRIETAAPDPTWPAPLDVSDAPVRP
jgi:hypothetical protein